MLYSAQTGGFYSRDIHASIPADAVTITDEEHAALLAGQSQGLQIVAGPGGRPELLAPPTPSAVPAIVSRFQARAALHLAGLLPQVEALMADPATDMLARLAWTDAQEFRRTSPTVLAMAGALGLDDAALDQLFTTAAGIEA